MGAAHCSSPLSPEHTAMKKEEKKRIMDKEKGKSQRTSAAQKAKGRSDTNVKNHASAGAKKQYKGWYCFGNGYTKEDLPNKTDACSVAYNGVEDKEWTGDTKEASCNKDNPFHHPYHHGADLEAR